MVASLKQSCRYTLYTHIHFSQKNVGWNLFLRSSPFSSGWWVKENTNILFTSFQLISHLNNNMLRTWPNYTHKRKWFRITSLINLNVFNQLNIVSDYLISLCNWNKNTQNQHTISHSCYNCFRCSDSYLWDSSLENHLDLSATTFICDYAPPRIHPCSQTM